MKKLILTVGMSCSGKTSWASEFVSNRSDWDNINRDEVRFGLFTYGERDWTAYKFTKKNEKRVTDICDVYAESCVNNGLNIIISDTNLSEKTRNKWKDFAKKHNYLYEEKAFPIEWEEAVKRNNQREGGISRNILWSQYLKMNEYLGKYSYTPDKTLPDAFICDIDGNIALKGKRGFYDWDKVGVDKPRDFVIYMVMGLIQAGYTPIFLSGRDASCQEETYQWINKEVMQYFPDHEGFHLYMRSEGDMRKDYIVKKELFHKYVDGKFNVLGVLDDRPQVINNCWLDLGLPNVISTADQNKEF